MTMLPKLTTVIMFATLLKLFGCSGQSNKGDTVSKSDSLSNQIFTSVEDFKNRTIYKVLTSEVIDTTSDENLLQTVFDNLSEKLPKDYDKEYEEVAGWNKPRQAIYIIWLLEAEVNNGGFNQFYFNSSGQFAELAPEALRLVEAAQFADLVTKANNVYKKEEEKITKHQDGTLEGFSQSYEDNPLNKFDDEFYALYKIENLQELQINFIRKNKEFFIDN
jgi:hypothetical protein